MGVTIEKFLTVKEPGAKAKNHEDTAHRLLKIPNDLLRRTLLDAISGSKKLLHRLLGGKDTTAGDVLQCQHCNAASCFGNHSFAKA